MKTESNKKLYWAPNVNWWLEADGLRIEGCKFEKDICPLFPTFYFIAFKGIDIETAIKTFNEFPEIKLIRFIKKLEKLHVLVSSAQDIDELFYRQSDIFQTSNYIEHDYFMNADKVEKYRQSCINRKPVSYDVRYSFDFDKKLPSIFTKRRSIRSFDNTTTITKQQLESVFSSISQYKTDNGVKYCYPSAGGLYPIDCYIFVKENRIEGIDPGLYLFDPIAMTLNFVADGKTIDRTCHYFLNRNIFDESAFSMFIFYNSEVSMPKYQSRAYFYGILDIGIMTGYLQLAAENVGISSCSIGDMKFENIKNEFKLNENQKFIHCIEFGIKKV